MGLVAKSSGGSSFKPAPAGTHIARCVSLIDLGMQTSEWNGEEKKQEQVLIGWELPEERVHTDDGDKPAAISHFYTKSLHEKATLRQHLESWRGREFTEEELAGFDIRNILDKPCLVTVSHYKKNNGDQGAKVTSVTPLHKSMTCPKREGDLLCFDIDDPDMDIFNGFSDGMKRLIEKSDNWKARAIREARGGGSEPGAYDPLPDDDSIPF